MHSWCDHKSKLALIFLCGLPLCMPVYAADVEQPVTNWTGFHIGVGAGYGMVNNVLNVEIEPDLAGIEIDGIASEGAFATIEAGYDFQLTDRFVLGVKADYSLQGVKTSIGAEAAGIGYSLQQQDSISVLVRGGRIVDANNMLYNILGWTHTRYEGSLDGGEDGLGYDFALNGLTFGGGIESILADNISMKLEYRYTMYQDISVLDGLSTDGLPLGEGEIDADATNHEQTIRAILTYRPGANLGAAEYEPHKWTGIHIGVGGGKGFINRELAANTELLGLDTDVAFSGLGAEGYSGSIVLGADYQIGDRFVVGIQGDYTLNAIDTKLSISVSDIGTAEVALEAKDSFTLSARAGVLSGPKVLWYGLAGWTHGDFATSFTAIDLSDDASASDSLEFSANGLTVGVGFEAMIFENASMKTEYRYTNFEAVNVFDLGDGPGVSALANQQSIRSVLSYRF